MLGFPPSHSLPLTTPHHTFLSSACPSPSPQPSPALPPTPSLPRLPLTIPPPSLLHPPPPASWVMKGVTHPPDPAAKQRLMSGQPLWLGTDANASKLHPNPEGSDPRNQLFPGPSPLSQSLKTQGPLVLQSCTPRIMDRSYISTYQNS